MGGRERVVQYSSRGMASRVIAWENFLIRSSFLGDEDVDGTGGISLDLELVSGKACIGDNGDLPTMLMKKFQGLRCRWL